MSRVRTVEDHYPTRRPAPAANLGPLFDSGYRADPPSIAKESSERGAEMAKKFAGSQAAAIMFELFRSRCVPGVEQYLSRDALIERIPGLSVNAATGRLGPSGPLQVRGFVEAVADACTSHAGNRVDGYRLTKQGVDWFRASGHEVPA
jgi:hypothetical protein